MELAYTPLMAWSQTGKQTGVEISFPPVKGEVVRESRPSPCRVGLRGACKCPISSCGSLHVQFPCGMTALASVVFRYYFRPVMIALAITLRIKGLLWLYCPNITDSTGKAVVFVTGSIGWRRHVWLPICERVGSLRRHRQSDYGMTQKGWSTS